jgi:Lhr-like helicase
MVGAGADGAGGADGRLGRDDPQRRPADAREFATIAELEAEIATLRRLEDLAERTRRSGTDAKWTRLAELLQDAEAEMFAASETRRKLIVFTEHRDTLNYLAARMRTLVGKPEAVVEIHGGLRRELRRAAQESFLQEPYPPHPEPWRHQVKEA